MGLMISHETYSGTCGYFNRWRNTVAEAAGYMVWDVRFSERDGHWKTVMIDWGSITEANLHGEWEKLPDDPLMLIIAHHDHTGKIPFKYCDILAERLEEILPDLKEYIHTDTEKFIAGLRKAARAGEDLRFY